MSRVCKCVVAIALSLAMALPGAAGAEGGMAYGDRGESVRAMQNRLTELGFFAGDVDGIYGDETQTAVKNFQTANGLANTGTADEITIARMRSEEAVAKDAYLEALVAQARQKESQMVAQPGDEGEAVLQVQNRLVELGYASGEASGRFGNATAESVSAFQAANGLPVTGAVNVATYDALFAESAIAYRAASTAASADTSLYLAKGDEGHNVEILQGYLREYGYYALEEDGVFDDGVEAAVLQFQRQNALEETGRVDATMRDMLSSGDVAYESAYAAQLSTVPVRFGDSGAAVRLLQTRLKALGYLSGSVDGEFGTNTQTAVSLFQKAHGLEVTGAADAYTRACMNAEDAIPYLQARFAGDLVAPIQYGDSGEEIAQLQRVLAELGYYADAIDGIFGANMLAAVKAFQLCNGLDMTGTVDEATRAQILSSDAVSREAYLAGRDDADEAAALLGALSSREACVEFVCRMALEKLGTPYAPSSSGPDSFDSSGFLYYVYGLVGFALPRSTQGQGYMTSSRVAREALSRGDFVCFDTEEDDDLSDHVGIYLGSGQFIHASDAAGEVVISSMEEGYYSEVFSWGIRPLQ